MANNWHGIIISVELIVSLCRKLNFCTILLFLTVSSILFCQNGQVTGQIYGDERTQSESCGMPTIIKNDLRTLAPWSAPIFRRHRHKTTIHPPTFYTNGIVIGPSLILSVLGGPLGSRQVGSARDLFVAAGINSSDFRAHDKFAQYSRISLIEPFRHHDVVNIYFHYVLYHLETPLDFSTPYVREICIPFYYTRKNLDWKIVNPWGWPTVQVGFGRPSSSAAVLDSRNLEKINFSKNPQNQSPWTLQVWEMITGPKKICESAFRFFYRRNLPYFCTKRISDEDKAALDTAYPRVFHSFDEARDRTDPKGQDDELCQGHGSANTYAYGNIWYLFSFVTMIPGKRRDRCGVNTVYGHTFSNPATYLQLLVWLFRTYKCGGQKIWCEDSLLCRPIGDVCNGISDCPNGSDEHEVTCRGRLSSQKNGTNSSFGLIDTSLSSEKNKFNLTLDIQIDPRDRDSGKCPDLTDLSMGTICTDLQTNETVTCKTTTFIGARIRVECDDWHTAPHFSYQFLTLFCDPNGEWQGVRPFHCEPECGIMKNEEGAAAAAAAYMGFPWHAAIFDEMRRQICGASLIEQKFLLTSANCLKNWHQEEEGGEEAKSNFTVIVRPVGSKFGENLNSPLSQEFQIKNVWFSNEEPSSSAIAIVELKNSVEINGKNKPMTVCYLLQNQVSSTSSSLTEIGQIRGQISGFKDVRGDGHKILNLTLVPNEQCGLTLTDLSHFCASSSSELDKATGLTGSNSDEENGGIGFFVPSTQQKSSAAAAGGVQRTVYNLKGIFIKPFNHSVVGGDRDGGGHSIFVNVDTFSNWILDTLERHSR